MLQCNMTNSTSIRLGLEDLLADLRHARRKQELGRLALLAYCEVRSWARQAGEVEIANHSTQIFTQDPCVSKEAFLAKVDILVTQLEGLLAAYPEPTRVEPFLRAGSPMPQATTPSIH